MSCYWLTKEDLSIEFDLLLIGNRHCLPMPLFICIIIMMQIFADHPETVEHLVSGCSQLAGHET